MHVDTEIPILLVVEDLIFLSKIRQTATLVDARIEVVAPAGLVQRLSEGPAAAVICDLNYRNGLALSAIRDLKDSAAGRLVSVIGFVSHVQTDLMASAEEAGCDVVMARSSFTKQLPQLLSQYSQRGAGSTPPA